MISILHVVLIYINNILFKYISCKVYIMIHRGYYDCDITGLRYGAVFWLQNDFKGDLRHF